MFLFFQNPLKMFISSNMVALSMILKAICWFWNNYSIFSSLNFSFLLCFYFEFPWPKYQSCTLLMFSFLFFLILFSFLSLFLVPTQPDTYFSLVGFIAFDIFTFCNFDPFLLFISNSYLQQRIKYRPFYYFSQLFCSSYIEVLHLRLSLFIYTARVYFLLACFFCTYFH